MYLLERGYILTDRNCLAAGSAYGGVLMKKKMLCFLLLGTTILASAGCGKKKKSTAEEAIDYGIRLEQQAQDAVDKNNADVEGADRFLDMEH